MKIESSGATHVGRKREGNEDSFLTDESVGLYIVCDGMGGHAAGEVASRRSWEGGCRASRVMRLLNASAVVIGSAGQTITSVGDQNSGVYLLVHGRW